MLQMWDTCYEIAAHGDSTIFNYNFGDKLNGYVSKFKDNAHGSEASTWAQLKEANVEPLEYYTEDLNQQIAELAANEAAGN